MRSAAGPPCSCSVLLLVSLWAERQKVQQRRQPLPETLLEALGAFTAQQETLTQSCMYTPIKRKDE